MNTAALPRDALMPRPPAGMGAGLVLAILIHALLVAALAFSVSWRSSEPDAVEAELWAAVPQLAAPPAPPPAPKPVEVEPPRPVPKREPVAAPEPAPDAQIAIEKARREEAKREELKREELKREERKREERKREEAKREQQRAEAERKKKELAEKEKEKKEAEQAAARHDANVKRMLAQAGAAANGIPGGTAAQSAGPSAGYAGRIKARIRPNIVLTDNVDGNPLATVEVRLAPDGSITSRRLVKSSGTKVWDEAVLRAVDKTEILPRDIDGRVPPVIEIDFKPRE